MKAKQDDPSALHVVLFQEVSTVTKAAGSKATACSSSEAMRCLGIVSCSCV